MLTSSQWKQDTLGTLASLQAKPKPIYTGSGQIQKQQQPHNTTSNSISFKHAPRSALPKIRSKVWYIHELMAPADISMLMGTGIGLQTESTVTRLPMYCSQPSAFNPFSGSHYKVSQPFIVISHLYTEKSNYHSMILWSYFSLAVVLATKLIYAQS